MKKYLFLSLLMGALGVFPAAVNGATISLVAPSPVTVGSTFWVDVNIATDGAENVWAYQFDIQFDPAILQFVDAQDGTFLPQADLALATLVWAPYTIGDGAVSAISNSLSGAAPGVSGSGLLAQVQFLALASADSTPLSPFNTVLLDFDLNQLGGVTETGTSVDVSSPASGAAPEPASFALAGLGLALALLRRR